MSILKLLGLGRSEDGGGPADAEAVREITAALDRLEPERARFVACFAYLLGRVANADSNISEEETLVMESLVVKRGGLSEEQAVIVVQIAKSQTRLFGATQNFLVAREFDEISTREQRLALLDCLYAVAAAEGGVSLSEDNEIRRISQEFRLDHREFIAVRARYRDELNVLDKE